MRERRRYLQWVLRAKKRSCENFFFIPCCNPPRSDARSKRSSRSNRSLRHAQGLSLSKASSSRKYEETGGALFNKNYAPLFSITIVIRSIASLRVCPEFYRRIRPRSFDLAQDRRSVQDIKKITTVQQFNSSTRTAKATPGFSSNRKGIDYPVRRYCSGQKKRWFKFPIHNVILALCYATASG